MIPHGLQVRELNTVNKSGKCTKAFDASTFCSEIPCSFVVLELLSYTVSFCFWDYSTVKSKKRLCKLEENMYLMDLLYVFWNLIG